MKMHFCFELDEMERHKWNQFWEKCEHSHPRQHYLFGQIEQAKGRIPIYVYAEVEESIVCIGIFSIRPPLFGHNFSFEAACLRGPAFDDINYGAEFIRETLFWFRSLHVGRLRISPYWYFPDAEKISEILKQIGFVPVDEHMRDKTGLINLQRSEEEIFASFERKTRQQINAASRLGATITPVTELGEARLAFDCLSSMRSQRGISKMSEKEFNVTFEHILKGQDIGLLLNAKLGPMFLGTIWNFRSSRYTNPSGYAIVPGVSKELPSNLSIGPALWWQMMKWAKSKGCRWFDVEGYIEKTQPDSLTYEVQKFKRRFSPEPVELISPQMYTCSPAICFLAESNDRIGRIKLFTMSIPLRIRHRLLVKKKSKIAGEIRDNNALGAEKEKSKNTLL